MLLYDLPQKRMVLSRENFYGRSTAVLGVAAHECGHAIQPKLAFDRHSKAPRCGPGAPGALAADRECPEPAKCLVKRGANVGSIRACLLVSGGPKPTHPGGRSWRSPCRAGPRGDGVTGTP